MSIDARKLAASATIGLIAAVGVTAYAARGGDAGADPALARSKAARSTFTTRSTSDPNRQLRHVDVAPPAAPAIPVVEQTPATAPVVQQAAPAVQPEHADDHDDEREWEGDD